MKIIFLDIDGVLNSQLYAEKHHNEPNEADASVPYPMSEIDPVAVGFLNELIAQTGAKVVISSTWRKSHTISELQAILAARGFTGEIIDHTPIMNGVGLLRGNEILMWIRNNFTAYNEFKSYVIFDDDSDMLLWQAANFIHVDNYAGLTPNHCYKAQYILGKKDGS